ncbi:snoaL-like domain-containing protein [Hirsutella rhossiliensis]|uniref:SnoaL-like domain-containing protein n=1 Tax=Hirsutella rhossiliensis TaxID=111463 RepID=A0A9P8MSS5_9HYPO|nr:snoaL-like domain-containing protein [Hirsutella rhossiliensis]KAH0959561.1 snoaL-like domain-containing protein [Hirsutella rhossiliensis]
MPGFVLTKEHILAAFAPLAETDDAAARARFFTDALVPDVTWHMAGSAHSLAGTRHSLQAHMDATFNRLGPRLRAPIRFDVTRVVVDAQPGPDGAWWACIETRGHAIRKASGKPYDNEYIWLTRWNQDGRMVEVRSYCDTMLAEEVLREPVE